jgi:hypothetical protein
MTSRVAPGFLGIVERALMQMPLRSAGPVRSSPHFDPLDLTCRRLPETGMRKMSSFVNSKKTKSL